MTIQQFRALREMHAQLIRSAEEMLAEFDTRYDSRETIATCPGSYEEKRASLVDALDDAETGMSDFYRDNAIPTESR